MCESQSSAVSWEPWQRGRLAWFWQIFAWGGNSSRHQSNRHPPLDQSGQHTGCSQPNVSRPVGQRTGFLEFSPAAACEAGRASNLLLAQGHCAVFRVQRDLLGRHNGRYIALSGLLSGRVRLPRAALRSALGYILGAFQAQFSRSGILARQQERAVSVGQVCPTYSTAGSPGRPSP